MHESIVFLERVRCRRKESSRSLSHLLMSFLYIVLPYFIQSNFRVQHFAELWRHIDFSRGRSVAIGGPRLVFKLRHDRIYSFGDIALARLLIHVVISPRSRRVNGKSTFEVETNQMNEWMNEWICWLVRTVTQSVKQERRWTVTYI